MLSSLAQRKLLRIEQKMYYNVKKHVKIFKKSAHAYIRGTETAGPKYLRNIIIIIISVITDGVLLRDINVSNIQHREYLKSTPFIAKIINRLIDSMYKGAD